MNSNVSDGFSMFVSLLVYFAIHGLCGWWAHRIATRRGSENAARWGLAGFVGALTGVIACAIISGPPKERFQSLL